MTEMKAFVKAQEKNIKTLKQYVPIVAKVHGGTHPEFFEVQKLFDAIVEKTKKAGLKPTELVDDFAQLRKVTHNYTVPNDVCESYEAVYKMLAELDKAY